MIWTVAAVAFLAFTLWLALGIRSIGRVTTGKPIGERSGTALLLIDLQTVFWRDQLFDAATRGRVETAVEREVETARGNGHPVIALRQEWSQPVTRMIARIFMRGMALAGSEGTEMAVPFRGMPTHVITKRVQDGFETGELDMLLRELDVGCLRIAGIDGAYCVARTAEAALSRGYEVILVTDAIATARAERQPVVLAGLTDRGARLAPARP